MGHIQKVPYKSKRDGKKTTTWKARYTGPDGVERSKRFGRKIDAEKWLDSNGADIARGAWVDPAAGKVTFREYAETWRATKARCRRSDTHKCRRTPQQSFRPVPW